MHETLANKDQKSTREVFFDNQKGNNEEAKKYLEHYNHLGGLKDDATEKANELLVKNIEHYRNFYTQLAGISLLTIAAILQVLSQEHQVIFKSVYITWIGTLFLALSAVCNICYLTYLISNENSMLNRKKHFYIRTFDEEITNAESFVSKAKPFSTYQDSYLSNMQKYAKEEKEMSAENWIDKLDFSIKWGITITFILGFVLAVISFF